jgi:DNA-binding response OmpR family regulator
MTPDGAAPRCRYARTCVDATHDSDGDAVPIRVLIAEDEANIAEALRFILGREGYEVACVVDGESALRRLRSDPPDVLMLDVMLPGMNGFEVLKSVRADAALSALPVVILTAKTQAQDRRLAEELGAQAYIAKPFSNREIVDQLRRLTAARTR